MMRECPIPPCLMYKGWESLARAHICEEMGIRTSDQPIGQWLEWLSYTRPTALASLKVTLYENHPDRGSGPT